MPVAATTITITTHEYNMLCKDSTKLQALLNAGVDNWEGYSDAMASLAEGDEP